MKTKTNMFLQQVSDSLVELIESSNHKTSEILENSGLSYKTFLRIRRTGKITSFTTAHNLADFFGFKFGLILKGSETKNQNLMMTSKKKLMQELEYYKAENEKYLKLLWKLKNEEMNKAETIRSQQIKNILES